MSCSCNQYLGLNCVRQLQFACICYRLLEMCYTSTNPKPCRRSATMQQHNRRNEVASPREDLAFESSNEELSLEASRELIRSLQSRQMQLEQQVAELQRSVEFHQAVIDSLPSSIAVLDSDGVIVAVNKTWLDFGSENGAIDGSNSLGVNYLRVCQSPHPGADATGASTMAAGIGEVLESKRTEFKYEYPCQTPLEKRWFQASVHAMPSSFPGVLVCHSDVTGLTEETAQRTLAESLLRESEKRYQYVEDATFRWESGIGTIPTGKCYYSSQWARLLGYEPDEIPSSVDFIYGRFAPRRWRRLRTICCATSALATRNCNKAQFSTSDQKW